MNYDLQSIQSAFNSLVKFKRDYTYSSLSSSLDSDLLGVSDSGKYLNVGVNPIITLRNIESLMPLESEMSVPAWSATVTYGIDDAVLDGATYYRSKVAGNLNNAVGETAYWTATSIMSIWIRSRLNGIYESVLGKSMIADKLFENSRIYRNCDGDDTIVNDSKFVGFEIRPKGSDHLKIILNRIATQFSADQANLTLYLFKQNTQVTTFTLSSLAAKEFAFTNITDLEITGEGRWFLYYDQDDLSGVAYNWSFDTEACLVDILPFEVANTTTDFINDVSSYNYRSYGLGLDLSIYGDLTNFILDNKQAFSEAIHLQWEYDMLELFLMNPDIQINPGQRNINTDDNRGYLIGQLQSETEHSVASRLDKAIKILVRSLSKGTIVLPETDDPIITYESYG